MERIEDLALSARWCSEAREAGTLGFVPTMGALHEGHLGLVRAAVAENERRIRELTRGAQALLAGHEHRKLDDVLAQAEKLQKHNAKLIRLIEHTEARLLRTAKQIARASREVKRE